MATLDVFPRGKAAGMHVSPVYLDRDATLGKIESLVREAATAGARIVAFPEAFLPGFPVWCLLQRPIDMHAHFKQLFACSVEVPGPQTARLAEIARASDVWLSVGISERSTISMGTMYNSNLLFSPAGELVNHHRKLVATWAERLVWGHGDGAGIRVIATDVGKLGMLICGENTNPLARYALMAQGEQVHIASYPPAWPFKRGGDAAEYRRWIETRSAAHAFEAKAYCLTVAAHLDEAAIVGAAAGDPVVEAALREAPPAVSVALGPYAERLGDPIQGEEGILYMDFDVSNLIVPKMAHDVVGSYQRYDVFEFRLNQRRQVASAPMASPLAVDAGADAAEFRSRAAPIANAVAAARQENGEANEHHQ
ncbi:MAG: carbon-nitrogen hydrolase family protein [Candidimonas sp.]|nr:MAG: carbon-nitrogen hydrolase family protein [Candidimonas sp.]